MDRFIKGLVLISALFTYSCEKKTEQNEDTVVFGKIVDWKTNTPIQGVSILKITICSDILIHDTAFVTQTDKDGKFEIKLSLFHSSGDPSEACGDYLAAHFPNYSDCGLGVKRGAINECNIRLVRNSYLKVHLKNATPCNSSDWFTFVVGFNNGWSQPDWSFYNSNTLDTVLTISVIPNYTHTILWNATKCSNQTSGSENVYFTSGDTIYRSIFY